MLMSAVLSLTTPTHPKPEDLAVRTLLITHQPSTSKTLYTLYCKLVKEICLCQRIIILKLICCDVIFFFVASTNPGSWQKVVSKLNLAPDDLISRYSSQLLRTILEGLPQQSEASRNALCTLVTLGAGLIVPNIVEHLCELLGNAEVRGATEEMLEIMYTPPGQLWHQGLLKE